MDSMRQVEAILFAVGKKISPEKIAILTSLELKEVNKVLKNLQKEYVALENSSLKVEDYDDGMWKLTVRDKYIPVVSTLVEETELERPLMETLAVIAWKYPIVQSEIVKLRGSGAYEHMRALVERGFIEKVPFGRTFKVKLTKKFFQYFDLPSEEAKEAFLATVPQEVLEDADSLDKEIDETERLSEQYSLDAAHRGEISRAMQSAKIDDNIGLE
ncbi:SMC-Scp complex subunit ScpB [archaeon]|jgi:segregation and condensation protein B|nr:SMC-Scp complex subunit ScpB [archaeon]MBT6697840.1 SMC-Scp complex subunit ScpB [archaeon]